MREHFRSVVARMHGGELTAQRVALSAALGLFIGTSPLYGLHAFIGGGLAFALRLDVLITYLATNISLPPLIPLIIFAEVQMGTFLLRGSFLSLKLDELAPEHALELGAALFIGWGVVGAMVALLGGALAYALGRSWEKRRRPS